MGSALRRRAWARRDLRPEVLRDLVGALGERGGGIEVAAQLQRP
jgi:hypothetical protein